MKKDRDNTRVIAIIAIIVSFVSIAFSAFAAFGKDWDIDNPSFPLGVLTLLVTILIGWQIVQYMYQKETVRTIIETEMKKARKETLFHKNNTLFIFSSIRISFDIIKRENNKRVNRVGF